MSITAYLSFNYADQILRERAGDQLISESTVRGDSIVFLLGTRIKETQVLASDPMIRNLVSELNDIDSLAELKEKKSQKQRDFLIQVQAFQELVGFSIEFEDVKIIGNDGQVYFSLRKLATNDFSKNEMYQRGLKEAFFDFEPAGGQTKLVVATPIYPTDNKLGKNPIGVLIAKMRTAAVDEILLNRSGLGQTGEVYIVDENRLMISESRFIENAIFRQEVNTLPVRKCFNEGEEVVGFYPDYRGVAIYGSSYCAQDLGFVLLAEIDEQETVQPILILQDRILETGILITTGMAIIAFIISKSLSKPLIKLRDAANKIAEGNFDVRTNIKTGDEIGQLSTSFDYMAKKLQESLIEIRQKEDVIKQQEDILLNFANDSENDCVCMIDIKDSTKITANLTDSQSSKLYGLFLNTMASIVRSHKGIVVKNIGDALLFYFKNPDTKKPDDFRNILNCCLKMSEIHDELIERFEKEKLPPVDYKISATYGSVRIAKITQSEIDDIFGSTVNRCAKINPLAPTNGLVIGESMYQIVKAFKEFSFTKIKEDSVNIHGFSVYSVERKTK
ncbi:MAG: cache domain-containing protein [Nitrosopumilaceae archaeon]|nr:cache domain-containing protein [Nitrosopumilaceae archaeon]